MSDYTAIYEAGESLTELLRGKMSPEPIEKKEQIGLCEPQTPEDFRLTVWIYYIEEQKDSGSSAGYLPDPENPAAERFAPMRLRLHALISAHSKAVSEQRYADEYRTIGRALQIIRDNPSIPAEYLRGTLAEQDEPVLLETVRLDAEQLSHIWNNTQKTVCPSFGVEISQVSVRSERTREIAPRVLTAEFDTRGKISGKGR